MEGLHGSGGLSSQALLVQKGVSTKWSTLAHLCSAFHTERNAFRSLVPYGIHSVVNHLRNAFRSRMGSMGTLTGGSKVQGAFRMAPYAVLTSAQCQEPWQSVTPSGIISPRSLPRVLLCHLPGEVHPCLSAPVLC